MMKLFLENRALNTPLNMTPNSLNTKTDIETSQMIYSLNQLTGFYTMATLAFNELIMIIFWRVMLKFKDFGKIINS